MLILYNKEICEAIIKFKNGLPFQIIKKLNQFGIFLYLKEIMLGPYF